MRIAYFMAYEGAPVDAITKDVYERAVCQFLKRHQAAEMEHCYNKHTNTYAISFVVGFTRYAKIVYLKG